MWATQPDPQSFNRYSYALNNPLSFTDSKGLLCEYYADNTEDGILERRPGRLDRDDRLDQFWPSVGDQPAERPRLGMCQDDRGTNAIEQRGRCVLVEPLSLYGIGRVDLPRSPVTDNLRKRNNGRT